MSGDGSVPAEMELAVEELNFPEAVRPEIVAALKSAGMQRIGDLVSRENLESKGLDARHVSSVVIAMYELGMWMPKPSCEKPDGKQPKHEC